MTEQTIPCPREHMAKLRKKKYMKEYNKKYRSAHKAEIAEHDRHRYQSNKHEFLERSRQYRESHKLEIADRHKRYSRSKNGLVSKIYSHQKERSKKRNHPEPEYTIEELRQWIFSRPNFEEIYNDWMESGFKKEKKPSCDRLDDYTHYRLDNIQLKTWQENNDRYSDDAKNGINTKKCKAVLQITRKGVLVKEYYSASHASRATGINRGNLTACCRGKYNTAGGFVWRFADLHQRAMDAET